MSLPSYVINFSELADLLNELKDKEREKGSTIFNSGKQMSRGIRLQTDGEKTTISDIWQPESDVWVTGIKLGISNRDSMDWNKIDILLENDPLYDGVFLKKESDYKNFRIFQHIKPNETLEIILTSANSSIEVWIDIDYVLDIGAEVEINDKEVIDA